MKSLKSKSLCILLAVCILASSFSLLSCAKDEDDGKISIVCTLFPQYDWIKNVTLGSDNVELTLIIANGSDPHSYQPTAADVMTISNCDILVYVGGDSDEWVKKAVERSKNQGITEIVLTELEGMNLHNISSGSHSHDGHSHSEDSHDGHSHSALDEHVYLSLRNATTAVNEIAEILSDIDPENAELYSKNSQEYREKLGTLSSDIALSVGSVPEEERFILFADRFPFVYLLSDYGIHYSAAFEGCTTDVDANFDTVLRLIHEADEHNVKYIAVTESSDKSLAETVISSTKDKNQKILTFNSMQAVSQKNIDQGTTYLSIMEENATTLKTALGLTN